MVKIIDQKTETEKALERKTRTLSQIARSLFPCWQILKFAESNTLNVDYYLSIVSYSNTIVVGWERYYDAALCLAEAYETRTGEEFTLRTAYNDYK